MRDKFVIIDGNSLAHRAFHALPQLTNKQGFITNAIFGFYKMLMKVIEDEKPVYLAVAFDKGKKVFRHEYYADYKGTRKGTPEELKPQFPVLKELLKAMKVAVFEIKGYEADDLIGTLAKLGEKAGLLNLIVTGDRDALQLISAQTKVFLTRKGISELEVYTEQVLVEKYGLQPEQMIDVKGLMGDSSDNIPGIPGVGEKTALKLIKKYNDLENVLAHRSDFQGKKLGENLTNYEEQALLSKKLATIVTDVPITIDLKQCQKAEPDYSSFLALLKELEFKSIIQDLRQKRPDLEKELSVESDESLLLTGLVLSDKNALQDYLVMSSDSDKLVIYLNAVQKSHGDTRIKALGVKLPNKEAAFCVWEKDEELNDYLQELKPYLENEMIKKITYDSKTVGLVLSFYQIKLQGVSGDVLLMGYLLNPSRAKNDLLSLVQDESDYIVPAEGETQVFVYLNALEELEKSMAVALVKQEMWSLYQDLELPLAGVLAEMEQTGVKLDQVILAKIGKRLEGWITNLTAEIYDLAGEEFNINSPKQLGVILFEKLSLPPGKKTKTGYSTDAEVLETLAIEHEIAAKILLYRQMVKLKSTYIDGLSVLINPFTSKVHTSFNQAVTATGRLSSTEPNLQNIPIRMEEGRQIRKAFLSSPGKMLLSVDYSQIELRVLAHVSGDEVMIDAFNNDQDIHLRTAAEVFSVSLEAVTEEMRQAAKAVNFGIVYGISDFGLSRDLGIPREEAKQYIDSYFARYQGVRDYLRMIVALAKKKGYVTTLLKRRRYLPELQSRNFHLRGFAERAAMNTPIQGSAADIIKLAMLKLYQVLPQEVGEGVDLLLQVHDELIFDVPEEKIVEVGALVKEIMSTAYPLSVPLKAVVQVGPNWYDLQPLKAIHSLQE